MNVTNDFHKKRLKISVNKELIDKIQPKKRSSFNTGFQSYDATIYELADAINEGMAFSYQFTDGKRSKDNFRASDILAVDIDGNIIMDDAREDPIVKKYGSLLYTTVNHTLDQHRFRLVFILPRTITDADQLRSAARSLTSRLGGDMASTDAARLFCGSKGSVPEIHGNMISTDFLNELIEEGKCEPVNDSIANKGKTSNRSSLKLDGDREIRTAQNKHVELKTISKNTSIYCPFHNDTNPSAFVDKNKLGDTYVHCSTCQKTWWMKGKKTEPYDFNSFETELKELKTNKSHPKVKIPSPKRQSPLGMYIEDNPIRQATDDIHITNSQYLSDFILHDGLSLIKSPKGSGKTEVLSNILKHKIEINPSLEKHEEAHDYEASSKIYTGVKVLLIGHRQALIGELCERLHLNSYLDKAENEFVQQLRFGVCLDSIMKVMHSQYDLIVLDEVEQVLGHFMAETIGSKRNDLFDKFKLVLQGAKSVIALDADLGWVTFDTLNEIMNPPNRSVNDSVPIHFYINEFQVKKKSIHIYPNENMIINKIASDLICHKRIFVASNSKKKIDQLTCGLEDLKKSHPNIRIMKITSENSGSKDIQDFIKNVTTRILDYDIVLSSPSLGTGIDITFDYNAEEIDCVFGLFENRINSHFDIDQQLARVRHPKEINVWVSPARFNFETDVAIVKREYLFENLASSVFEKAYIDDIEEINTSRFLRMVSLIISQQRASKNNLKSNFIHHKIHQGWEIIDVDPDQESMISGAEFKQLGVKLNNKKYEQKLLNATVFNRYEYLRFQEKTNRLNEKADEDEWIRLFRTNLELFYREPISSELIQLDNQGKFRKQIRLFEKIKLFDGDMTINSNAGFIQTLNEQASINPEGFKEQKISFALIKNDHIAVGLLHYLLKLTPIFDGTKFNPSVIFTKDDLTQFAQMSKKLSPISLVQLDVNTQNDVKAKPTQHLNKLLKLIGLRTMLSGKPTRLMGHKTYLYILIDDDLNRNNELVQLRSDTFKTRWDDLHKRYNLKPTNNEKAWIEKDELNRRF